MYVMRRIENSTICLENLDFYLMKFKKKRIKTRQTNNTYSLW